ncbi:universal stress protein [Lyngbya confervoides]|uniref:Universal stress protein n=1 Tax=Lyngbya confervoides BDU141951 TaxID=1574623 RepID=A0ABD4SZR7_9CYAN|nr:universal stress protein [Lyngbya confervoides]MCM1981641.1 universal stress protein [Lyngbya confervoides BDU141951]
MLNKILLADAGTGQAEQMLDKLLEMPTLRSANVTVLNVVPEKNNAEDMAAQREEAAKILAKTVQTFHLEDRDILSINTMIREGDPKVEVCRAADEIDADLIIMGSRGLKRLRSILENSVSQYVFQLSSHPMLLVKDDIFIKRIKRVMVALNPSASSQAGLNLAARLLRDVQGGQLILTHVSKQFTSSAKLADSDAQEDPVLSEGIKLAKREGLGYQCYAGTGKAGESICQLAEASNADLLVMGSPDRRPSIARSLVDLDRLLGSSVSDYVRVNTPCPVLFVRQKE